jgi:V/A-type H+-transporting ATPase subunit I
MKTPRSQAMNKLELVVPERDIVPVTEALAATGNFHLTGTRTPGVEDASRQKSDWHEQAVAFTTLERRVLGVMEALGVNEGTPPPAPPHLIWPEVAQTDVERLEQETQGPVQELEEEQRSLDRLQRYLNQLKPIADLDVDLDILRNLHYTFLLPGRMPTTNIERLQSSLEHIPSMLVPLHHENHLATVVLIGLQRDADILNRAARSAYLNPLELPEAYRGTPAQTIAALEEGIERRYRRIAERRAAIEHLHETRISHLRHLLWRVRASRTLAEIIAGYGRLRYTYLVAGWVPTSRVDMVQQKVQRVSDRTTIEVSAPRKEEETHVPVALDNPPPIKAFQGLVTTYGYPRYGEIDPTTTLALTFPLIFGIMFGDVGHGLLLSLLGLLLTSRKIRALRGLASLGPILTACGVVAAVFGFLYGSIFGFEDILTPLWIRPLEKIMDILLATVGIGIGLLSLGMACNILNAILARRWGRLLFDHNGLAGLVFYWSSIGLAAGSLVGHLPINPAWLAVLTTVSGLAVTFSELLEHIVEGHRPLIEGSFGTYLMQALFELFETVIGLLSNTLSYVRMGAFAVAHGALSLVVFIIAETISPARGVGYWIVVALGNLFVIGFEGMLVGIQTLRLEYYEFFSKFFSGGGVRYRPLALIPRNESESEMKQEVVQ